jgi:hypothetical protein
VKGTPVILTSGWPNAHAAKVQIGYWARRIYAICAGFGLTLCSRACGTKHALAHHGKHGRARSRRNEFFIKLAFAY